MRIGHRCIAKREAGCGSLIPKVFFVSKNDFLKMQAFIFFFSLLLKRQFYLRGACIILDQPSEKNVRTFDGVRYLNHAQELVFEILTSRRIPMTLDENW